MDQEVAASIKAAFRQADQNGDGLISLAELQQTFRDLGDWSDEEFDVLFAEADQNSDGKLGYEEFVDWLMKEGDDDEEQAMDMALDAVEGPGEGSEAEFEDGESEEEDSDWCSDEEGAEEWEDFGWDDQEEPPVDAPDSSLTTPEDGSAFTDDVFPASKESVGSATGDTVSGVNADEATSWRRLPELGGDGVSLFKDIKPNDVKQGGLGNCWFLAACASVACYPAWIRQMFSKSPEINKAGRYEVRLYHPGKKTFIYISVSDEVPCSDEEGYEPCTCFSSLSDDNEIWPCLVEKAFSKLFKSYAATEGGFPAWGMTYLCGGLGEQWDNQGDGNWSRKVVLWGGGDGDQLDGREGDEVEGFEEKNGEADYLPDGKLWQALLAYTEKSFAMCCSTDDKKPDMQGLIEGHAYSLIAVRQIKLKEKTLRLCKIRNPHGETEWTGHWGDTSDMWKKHPNIAKELRFKVAEDGSFWMAFKDFTKFYGTVSVCKRSMPLEGVHPDQIRAVAAAKKARAENS